MYKFFPAIFLFCSSILHIVAPFLYEEAKRKNVLENCLFIWINITDDHQKWKVIIDPINHRTCSVFQFVIYLNKNKKIFNFLLFIENHLLRKMQIIVKAILINLVLALCSIGWYGVASETADIAEELDGPNVCKHPEE